MEPRISIITLGVKDFDRALRFYRDGLGFTNKAKEGDSIAFFQTAGTRLALYATDRASYGDLAQLVTRGRRDVFDHGFQHVLDAQPGLGGTVHGVVGRDADDVLDLLHGEAPVVPEARAR